MRPVLIAFAVALSSLPSASAQTIGPEEVVLTKEQRDGAGLNWWPDGTMGVIRNGDEYSFFAANSGHPGLSRGNLANPIASGATPHAAIAGIKHDIKYAAGGPVYAEGGRLFMIYHAERWIGGDSHRFYSTLGLAQSTDGGNSWEDSGEIISPNVPMGTTPIDIGGGALVSAGPYLYVYFQDILESGEHVPLAVARALKSDLIAPPTDGRSRWMKWFDGAWSQPGLGGKSTALNAGRGWFASAAYSKSLGKFLMVFPDGGKLTLLESSDGVSWERPTTVAPANGAEQFYPTIVGAGPDPQDAGSQFFVYYTRSQLGKWDRWTDAALVRRLVSFGGPAPAPVTDRAAARRALSSFQQQLSSLQPEP